VIYGLCRQFGVPLIDDETVRWQAIVRVDQAMDMILTGRAVLAQEALTTGLANSIVPKGIAAEEALRIAEMLSRPPKFCMTTNRDIYFLCKL
jgi:enoyl-CoA hydratase